MKIKDAWDLHRTTYKQASDINRQLGFAGIAIIWVFKTETMKIPGELIWPGILLVVALACDLLQHFIHSVIWHFYLRYFERKGLGPDTEFYDPPYINYPAYFLWATKFILTGGAYIILIRFLLHTLPQ
jgi:hypothetical protein